MILVSGGTGLLGSNLLYSLCASGEKVRALYRDKNKIRQVERLFHFYQPEKGEELFAQVEWIRCDILDVVDLEKVIKDCRIIYHCAALVSFRRRDFSTMMKINRQGTANIVNLALDNHIEKLCFVSSTAAVGKVRSGDVHLAKESNKWTQSPKTSGYSISKYSAEKEVWRGIEEGLNAVIINPSVIFGPGSWNESSLTIFKTLSKGMKFYTSGSNAFVDVRDVVQAMIQLTNSTISAERFLCTGTNIVFKDLFRKIAAQLHVNAPTYRANRFMCEIAWRIASLLALIGRTKATLTKESVQSAQSRVVYDSSRLRDTLKMEFRELDETISFTIAGRL